MKNKQILSTPATIIEKTISGFTIKNIENFRGQPKNYVITEQLSEAKATHIYIGDNLWLKKKALTNSLKKV